MTTATPTYPVLTFADAVADCPEHRAQHEEAEARYAKDLAEYGASIQIRDRRQLGLHIAPVKAVTA
ncbi:hypothetical protein CLM62_12690 [Streptomyces sp. SA15]|uniref:hypothetical protein n=1 Tax=Streptomyces sp. SA15 TaxID=934019 RepID=UPI000BAFCF9C|nr:hypothetical protein [Streptomyces sp. SA15]PAZ15647.1 hypothetical protein CLM62_12690 [Streptomyces sp. SA15]